MKQLLLIAVLIGLLCQCNTAGKPKEPAEHDFGTLTAKRLDFPSATVRVTNTTGRAIKIWDESCPWGAFALSIELTDGKKRIKGVRHGISTMLSAESIEIPPGATHEIELAMRDNSWRYDSPLPDQLDSWKCRWLYRTTDVRHPITDETVDNIILQSPWYILGKS